MERAMRFVFWSFVTLTFCLPASAQQIDINHYTLFTGFDYMISPARNLTERGFETDFGDLFSNLLAQRQNYIRFSCGPTFRWGHGSQ